MQTLESTAFCLGKADQNPQNCSTFKDAVHANPRNYSALEWKLDQNPRKQYFQRAVHANLRNYSMVKRHCSIFKDQSMQTLEIIAW